MPGNSEGIRLTIIEAPEEIRLHAKEAAKMRQYDREQVLREAIQNREWLRTPGALAKRVTVGFFRRYLEERDRKKFEREIIREKDLYTPFVSAQSAAEGTLKIFHKELTAEQLAKRAEAIPLERKLLRDQGVDPEVKLKLIAENGEIEGYDELNNLLASYLHSPDTSEEAYEKFEEEFKKELGRTLERLGHGKETLLGTDVERMLERVRVWKGEHKRGLESLDGQLSLHFIRLGTTINAEAELGLAEKAAVKIEETRLGRMAISPIVLGLTALGVDLGIRFSTGTVSKAARAATFGLPVLGSVFSFFRIKARIKEDIASAQIRKAMGLARGGEGKWLEKIEPYLPEQKDFRELIRALALRKEEVERMRRGDEVPEEFLKAIVEIDARDLVGRMWRRDLISYVARPEEGLLPSEAAKLGANRLALLQARAEARVFLKEKLASLAWEEEKIDELFETRLKEMTEARVREIEDEVEEKSKEAEKFVLKETGKRTLVALGVGVGIGLVASAIQNWVLEVRSTGGYWLEKQLIFPGEERAIPLEKEETLTAFLSLRLPQGFVLEEFDRQTGGVEIRDPEGLLHTFRLNEKGLFDSESLARLKEMGLLPKVSEATKILPGKIETIDLSGMKRLGDELLGIRLPNGFSLDDFDPKTGRLAIKDPLGRLHTLHLDKETGEFDKRSLEELGKLGLLPEIKEGVKIGEKTVERLTEKAVSYQERFRDLRIAEVDKEERIDVYHVLRPDIVKATGRHTHNELTLHIGQYLDRETGKWTTKAGILNFGGEISGKLIPSHLKDIEPMYDPFLKAHAGEITHSDMGFLIRLLDGRQILLDANKNGNAILPTELLTKEGEPAGIFSIAAVILEKDGKIISADDVVRKGELPKETIIHSLASVQVERRKAPGDIFREITERIKRPETVVEEGRAIEFLGVKEPEEIKRKIVEFLGLEEPKVEIKKEWVKTGEPTIWDWLKVLPPEFGPSPLEVERGAVGILAPAYPEYEEYAEYEEYPEYEEYLEYPEAEESQEMKEKRRGTEEIIERHRHVIDIVEGDLQRAKEIVYEEYLENPEIKEMAPQEAVDIFRRVADFVFSEDLLRLELDDGSVSLQLRRKIEGLVRKAIEEVARDEEERTALIQIVGKFLNLHGGLKSEYLTKGEVKRKVLSILQAVKAVRKIALY